ncbi:MAG: hypothetical protein IJX90_05235 [Blautia sp.]|nr:hypothetical protein [Blautia sp.]
MTGMIIFLLLMAAIGSRGSYNAGRRSVWGMLPLCLLGLMFFSPVLGLGLILVRLVFKVLIVLFLIRFAAAFLARL